jgi:hypothetical protein
VKRLLIVPLAALALVGGAGAHAKAQPKCAFQAGWQKLANQIKAPVYCPGWLPDPLTSQIGGRWNIIHSVSKDRSYLIGFAWQELGQEIHINLRGYPGRTAIPTCREVQLVDGKSQTTHLPCFDDPHGTSTVAGFRVTMFTVNQDADMWHVLYAWRYRGSLYTISQHIAPPLTYPMVLRDLKQELASLVLVRPS